MLEDFVTSESKIRQDGSFANLLLNSETVLCRAVVMSTGGFEPVIIVHGGAWAIPDTLKDPSLHGVQIAAKAGWEVLLQGGSAVDAVEKAITLLENDPTFDAGTGSVFTAAETIEMDAIIMEGTNLSVGAVAAVENVKNPIQLARIIMEKTEHTMLVGVGANAFAAERGIPSVPLKELETLGALEELQRFKTYKKAVTGNFSERQDYKGNFLGHDTVGCVAMDRDGLLACGTSTGGITGKRPGRVGDSPLVGCGAYADNESGAVSCTGHGESIAKVCLARRIVEACERGLDPSDAVNSSLNFMGKRVGNAGGAICINAKGQAGFGFNSERMAWAKITTKDTSSGVEPGDSIPF